MLETVERDQCDISRLQCFFVMSVECEVFIKVNAKVFVDRRTFDICVVYRDFRKGFSEIVFLDMLVVEIKRYLVLSGLKVRPSC